MKVAIVNDVFLDKGNGTSMSAINFVKKLEERGIEVVVLCYGEKKGKDGKFYYFDRKWLPDVYKNVSEEQHAILAEPDDKLIKEALSGCDICHIYLPFWLGTHSAKIANELNIPVLGCYHVSAENITYNAGLKNVPFSEAMVYTAFRDIHYRYVNNIYCPSQCIADRVKTYGYNQNMHIISNGYNENFKQNSAKKPEEFKDKKIIISVGRLTKEKRQELIIKAIGASKHKEEIVLILAGKGALQEKYEELAEKLGVDLKIVFLSQEELINTLNYCDLFIQASDVETESISCLEAIACGTVPIISDAKMCATKQFALDEKSLFMKGNSASLTEKIDLWLEHPKYLKAMRANYAESAKKYSIEKSIDSIIDVYNFIINDKNKTHGMVKNYNNPDWSYNQPQKKFSKLITKY